MANLGPISAVGHVGNGPSCHLATIERLSNGFVVRYVKAQKVAVKPQAILLDPMTKSLVERGLKVIEEHELGEEWKERAANVKDAMTPKAESERWSTSAVAIACKNEEDLIAAIRDAVTANDELAKLVLAGEFDGQAAYIR